jgi:hypothetical protein
MTGKQQQQRDMVQIGSGFCCMRNNVSKDWALQKMYKQQSSR